MNIEDAAYHVVHDYPGGSESLGPRLGMSCAVLRNKVNPRNETHRLALAEAARITDISDDDRILRAWAHQRGYLLVKAPSPDVIDSDMSVLEHVVGLGVAKGEFLRVVNEALSDGRIDAVEVQAIRRAARILKTEVAEVVERVAGMSDK